MKRSALATVPLVASALAAGFQSAGGKQIRGWQGKGGKEVAFIGACSFTETDMHCWNADGDADAALTERVSTFYKNTPYADLRFSYGKKNRLAVFRVTGDMWVMAQNPSGSRLPATSTAADDGRTLLAVSVSVDLGAASASLALTVDSGTDSIVDVPAKKGMNTTLGGTLFEIGSVDDGHDPDFTYGAPDYLRTSKSCTILVGSNVSVAGGPPFEATALDRSKKPIRYVDKQGHPVEPKAAKATSDGTDKPIDALWLWEPWLTGAPELYRMIFNIDPGDLAYVRISKVDYKSVPIVGIPLEPHS